MDDPNHDLIGYEFTGHDGVTWRVMGTDTVLRDHYVELRRVLADGRVATNPFDMRVQVAGTVRRRREIEREAA